jgi:hypothetical protein
VVKLIEFNDVSYVVKELPDDLALREFRLLRSSRSSRVEPGAKA